MARPLRIIFPGAYYHVTTRGNERADIYKSQRDREKFLSHHICHKYSGSKLKEIGQHFAIRESAITEASRRFQLKMEKDKELGRMDLHIKGRLKI